jgi:hypothetical protein
MKHLVLILSIPLVLATGADAAPVVFIVRHAEKASTGGKVLIYLSRDKNARMR